MWSQSIHPSILQNADGRSFLMGFFWFFAQVFVVAEFFGRCGIIVKETKEMLFHSEHKSSPQFL
jgi:hypothetical protein